MPEGNTNREPDTQFPKLFFGFRRTTSPKKRGQKKNTNEIESKRSGPGHGTLRIARSQKKINKIITLNEA